MSFPIRRVDVEPGVCGRCNGETHRATQEQIDDVWGIPFFRKFMRYSRCRACGSLEYDRDLDAVERMGLTPGVKKWLVATWSMFAVAAVVVLACFVWSSIRQRANATSPLVGDEWTIKTKRWRDPGQFRGDVGEYMRVKVSSVSSDEIGLMACRTTYADESDADNCDTFDLAIKGVAPSSVQAVYDEAIVDVDSTRDDHKPLVVGFGIIAALVFAWGLIAQRWKARIAISDF